MHCVTGTGCTKPALTHAAASTTTLPSTHRGGGQSRTPALPALSLIQGEEHGPQRVDSCHAGVTQAAVLQAREDSGGGSTPAVIHAEVLYHRAPSCRQNTSLNCRPPPHATLQGDQGEAAKA